MWADARIQTPGAAGGTGTQDDVANAVVTAITRDRVEVEVAPLAIRVGGALAPLRPGWFIALGRRAGADEMAAAMTRASRDKR